MAQTYGQPASGHREKAEVKENLREDTGMPDAPREHAGDAEGRQEETRQLEDQKKLTNERDQGACR